MPTPLLVQLVVNWWVGILGIPLSNNPFHKEDPIGIQTTNPNHHNKHETNVDEQPEACCRTF